MLIYILVNSAFSNFVRLKLALVIQLFKVVSYRIALYMHYSNNKVVGAGVSEGVVRGGGVKAIKKSVSLRNTPLVIS